MMHGRLRAMRAKISGVNTIRKWLADGSIRIYYYHRDTGTRLNGVPGSPEFIASYAAAERKVAERHVDLCSGLIHGFLTSAEFKNNLQPTTQAEYRQILTAIEAKFGKAPIAALADSRFAGDALEWRDEIATQKPREADNRMIVFARLYLGRRSVTAFRSMSLRDMSVSTALIALTRFGFPSTSPLCKRWQAPSSGHCSLAPSTPACDRAIFGSCLGQPMME